MTLDLIEAGTQRDVAGPGDEQAEGDGLGVAIREGVVRGIRKEESLSVGGDDGWCGIDSLVT